MDDDNISDDEDNCPNVPNGPNLGICYSWSEMISCTTNSDCGPDGFCSMNQEDDYRLVVMVLVMLVTVKVILTVIQIVMVVMLLISK